MVFAFSPGNCSDCCTTPTCSIGSVAYTPDLPIKQNVVYVRWSYTGSGITANPCAWWDDDSIYLAGGVNGEGKYGPKNTANSAVWGYWLAFYDSEDGDNIYFRRDSTYGGPILELTVAKKSTLTQACSSPLQNWDFLRVTRIYGEDPNGDWFEQICDTSTDTITKTASCGGADPTKFRWNVQNKYHERIWRASTAPATINVVSTGFASGGVLDCNTLFNISESLSLRLTEEEDGWLVRAAWGTVGLSTRNFQWVGVRDCSGGDRLNTAFASIAPNPCSSAGGYTQKSTNDDYPYNGNTSTWTYQFITSRYASGGQTSIPCGTTPACPTQGTFTVTF